MTLPRLWTRSQELDPFRVMRREMENAFRAFDQKPTSPDIGAGAPAINVAETNDAFEVTAELPGVDKKDLDISMTDDSVLIKGSSRHERKEKKENYTRTEMTRGEFSRTIALPAAVDSGKAKASYKDGILELVLPKVEARRRHTIAVA